MANDDSAYGLAIPPAEMEAAELRAENARLRAALYARCQDIAALQAGQSLPQATFDAGSSWREFFAEPARKYSYTVPVDDHDVA